MGGARARCSARGLALGLAIGGALLLFAVRSGAPLPDALRPCHRFTEATVTKRFRPEAYAGTRETFAPPPCSSLPGAERTVVFLHTFGGANAWRTILDDTMRTLQHSPLLRCGSSVRHSTGPGAPWPYPPDDLFAPAEPSRHPLAARVPVDEPPPLSRPYEP